MRIDQTPEPGLLNGPHLEMGVEMTVTAHPPRRPLRRYPLRVEREVRFKWFGHHTLPKDLQLVKRRLSIHEKRATAHPPESAGQIHTSESHVPCVAPPCAKRTFWPSTNTLTWRRMLF